MESAPDSATVVETAAVLPAGVAVRDDAALPVGAVLGRYLVIEELGRGGMGVVWRAYDPKLQREVALKMLRHHVMSDDARARMIREARAMAKLNHPNVVAIYDVDLDGDVVALAMEYVPGGTLRAWLRAAQRTTNEVLAAFVQAGRGLAAAHAEGLLHRDFKPANVLVAAAQGGRLRVKVTDFGIARVPNPETLNSGEFDGADLLRSSSGSSTDSGSNALTQAGIVMGTPRYMAPEQHAGTELDAATDQYAFCIALWEALVGMAPFDGNALARQKQQGPPPWPKGTPVPSRVAAALRRGLAAAPSDRFPDMATLLETLAIDRRARPAWFGPAVVVGALALGGIAWAGWSERNAARCSGAATQLADVWDESRRTIVEQAVLAANPVYAHDVWARIAPGLDAYAVAWTLMHTEACEATAVRGEQSAAVMDVRMACLHRAKEDLRAAVDVLASADVQVLSRAHAVVEGLPDLARCADIDALQADVPPPAAADVDAVAAARAALADAAALRKSGRVVDARAAIDRADESLVDVEYEPVRTEIELERATILDEAGEYPAAEAALQRAMELGARWSQWSAMARATTDLVLVVGIRQARYAEGAAYVEIARALVERTDDPASLATLRLVTGTLLQKQAKLPEAEAMMREGVALRERAFGPDNAGVIKARATLANVLHMKGDYAAAEIEMRAVLDWRSEALGPEHPDVASAHNNLATTLKTQGKLAEAERHIRTALVIWEEAFGPDHPDLARGHNTLGNILIADARYDEALVEMRTALTTWERRLGPNHPDVALAHSNLGAALGLTGDHEGALAESRIALRIRETALGPDHPDVATSRMNIASTLQELGRDADAEIEYRAALGVLLKSVGPRHADVALARLNLGSALGRMKRFAESEAETREAIEIFEATIGPDHMKTAMARRNLSFALSDAGRPDAAEAELRIALRSLESARTDDHPDIALLRSSLGHFLLEHGRAEEALPLLEQAWSVQRDHTGPADHRAATAAALARALWATSGAPANRTRARAVALEAEASYVAAGPGHLEELAAVRAWLRSHA